MKKMEFVGSGVYRIKVGCRGEVEDGKSKRICVQ